MRSSILFSNSWAVKGTAATLLIPIVSIRYLALIIFDNWPVFSSGIITFLNLLKTSAVLSGNGFRWTKWALATLIPFLFSLLTACVIPPKVEPQPKTSVSEFLSPWISKSSMSLAMFSIFQALISVIYWWFAES